MTIPEIYQHYGLSPGSAGYGARWDGQFHWGIDCPTPVGVTIHAHIDCKLVLSGFYDADKAGYIVMEALDGSCNWLIAHVSEVRYNAGATVKAGTLLGKTGATGNVTGAHAHIEYDKGRFKGSITKNHNAGTTIDPLPIIKNLLGGTDMKEEEIAKGLYRVLVGVVPGDDIIKQKADYMRLHGGIDQVATDLRNLYWIGKDVAEKQRTAAVKIVEDERAALSRSCTDYRVKSENEMGQLSADVIKYKTEFETANERFDVERRAWKKLEDSYLAHEPSHWSWQQHLSAALSKLFGGGDK